MTVTRRSVLIASAAAPAAGAAVGAPSAWAADATESGAGRHTIPLLDGWRFLLADPDGSADDSTGAADPAYDDSAWREVAVPHDWSIEQTPTTEHGTTSGTGFLPGGLGWYRLAFTLPPALAGKRVSVEFDGVYMDSRVHCNGREAGRHPTATPASPSISPTWCTPTAAPRTSSRSRCATSCRAAAGTPAAASTARSASSSPNRCTYGAGARTSPHRG